MIMFQNLLRMEGHTMAGCTSYSQHGLITPSLVGEKSPDNINPFDPSLPIFPYVVQFLKIWKMLNYSTISMLARLDSMSGTLQLLKQAISCQRRFLFAPKKESLLRRLILI